MRAIDARGCMLDSRITRVSAALEGSAKRRVTLCMRWTATASAVYAIARIDGLSIKCKRSSARSLVDGALAAARAAGKPGGGGAPPGTSAWSSASALSIVDVSAWIKWNGIMFGPNVVVDSGTASFARVSRSGTLSLIHI